MRAPLERPDDWDEWDAQDQAAWEEFNQKWQDGYDPLAGMQRFSVELPIVMDDGAVEYIRHEQCVHPELWENVGSDLVWPILGQNFAASIAQTLAQPSSTGRRAVGVVTVDMLPS